MSAENLSECVRGSPETYIHTDAVFRVSFQRWIHGFAIFLPEHVACVGGTDFVRAQPADPRLRSVVQRVEQSRQQLFEIVVARVRHVFSVQVSQPGYRPLARCGFLV